MSSFTGERIRLNSIDAFWKKLDFKPAKKSEFIDVDAEFEKIKTQIKFTPPHVTKSYIDKIKDIFKPGKTSNKPPVVQKNTRGRPTLKTQEQRREEAARHSVHIQSEHSDRDLSYDLPRHSSYVSSQTSKPPTSLPGKKAVGTSHGIAHPDFPIIQPGPKSDVMIKRYAHQIPKMFQPYITKIKDVKPDGHCGFRATAAGLGIKQTDYMDIRQRCLAELRTHGRFWRRVFDPEDKGHYDDLYNRINFRGVGMATQSNWMDMPLTGFLIAQIWGVIVHSLDMRGNCTLFPIRGSPDDVESHLVVSLVFVDKSHFIHLNLQGSYPMPPPRHPLWFHHRSDHAAAWYDLFAHRIHEYQMLIRPDLIVNPDIHCID